MMARIAALVALGLASGWLAPLISWGQPHPSAGTSLAQSAQQAEEQYRWLEAAQLYAQLLAAEPDHAVWQEGLRRCLTQIRISQRYRDRALRAILEHWKLPQALATYEEFVQLVQHVVLETVSAEQLWRRGCEQTLWALSNPTYRAVAFTAEPTPGQLDKLREMLQLETHQPPPSLSDLVPQLRVLAQRARLYAPIRPTALVWEFLAAGCEALDAYGAYVTPTGLVLEKMLAEGKWVGVGLGLVASDSGILISGVAAQSEARQHGIQPGSWLVKVNGEPIRAGSVEEAMLRLLGPAGTSVELEILTPAGDRQLVQLTRRQYEPTSVNGVEMLDSMLGIGYVRVESFQPSTPQELDRAVQELSRQGMRILILDLRGNPGGSVRAALEVADRFISGGVLLITQGRWPEVNVEYMARQGEDWQLPVIVLVDEHTASAAEMVAGALQAHAQAGHIVAAVVGRPTRGKGVLQQCVPLAEGQAGAAYLTVARWLTPAGVPVSPQQPIQPDVLVKPMPMVADPMMDMDLPPMMFPNPSNSPQQTAWHAALGKAIELFRK